MLALIPVLFFLAIPVSADCRNPRLLNGYLVADCVEQRNGVPFRLVDADHSIQAQLGTTQTVNKSSKPLKNTPSSQLATTKKSLSKVYPTLANDMYSQYLDHSSGSSNVSSRLSHTRRAGIEEPSDPDTSDSSETSQPPETTEQEVPADGSSAKAASRQGSSETPQNSLPPLPVSEVETENTTPPPSSDEDVITTAPAIDKPLPPIPDSTERPAGNRKVCPNPQPEVHEMYNIPDGDVEANRGVGEADSAPKRSTLYTILSCGGHYALVLGWIGAVGVVTGIPFGVVGVWNALHGQGTQKRSDIATTSPDTSPLSDCMLSKSGMLCLSRATHEPIYMTEAIMSKTLEGCFSTCSAKGKACKTSFTTNSYQPVGTCRTRKCSSKNGKAIKHHNILCISGSAETCVPDDASSCERTATQGQPIH